MSKAPRLMFVPSTSNRERYLLNRRGYGSHQAILDLVKSNATILDIGPGAGNLAEQLREVHHAHVTGVELDSDAAEIMKSRGFEVLLGDITIPAVLGKVARLGPFDHVICGDILEHLVDPQRLLMDLRPMLKPTGTIIVSLPNVVSARARLTIMLGKWHYADTGIFDRTHLRFFTPATAKQLLFDSGFQVTDAIPVGPLTSRLGRAGVWITRLSPGLLATQIVMRAIA